MNTRRCKCGAEIFFALTPIGRRMPLDADPSDTGEWALVTFGPEVEPEVEYVGSQLDLLETRERFVAHWATCPDADDFR